MPSFEKPSQERNVEADKRAFIEAINSTIIAEIPTAFDENASQELSDNIAQTRIFILGEMHGVKENADIIYTLFKKFGFSELALEWEPELKDVALKYIETGELDFEPLQDSPDGRITPGHFALFKKLKSEGFLDGLVCFDGGSGGGGWSARDASMSQHILAHHSNRPMLVVAGTMHTRTEAFSFEGEAQIQHPMGENVRKIIPEVASGEIEYQTGTFYNYGVQTFFEGEGVEVREGARFYKDENGMYIFEIPQAHASIVPNLHERLEEI